MSEFVTKTQAQIVADFTRDVRLASGEDTREGSHAYAMDTAVANAVMPSYVNSSRLVLNCHPATASEAGLKRFAETTGPQRQSARKATGSIQVVSTISTTIPAGARLTNPTTDEKYEVVSATLVPSTTLTATVYIRALKAGPGANAVANTVLNFNGPPLGVDTKATVNSLKGGQDEWTIAEWAEAILRRMRQAIRPGNAAHYQALGAAVGGIEQVFVYGAIRGSGKTDVVLVTSAASGSRVASSAQLALFSGAMLTGVQLSESEFISGIPTELAANTVLYTAVPQPVKLIVKAQASVGNPFAVWPPMVDPANTASWYSVTSSTSTAQMVVTKPTSGTPVNPQAGQVIGAYFPSVGFAKATILNVVTTVSDWTLTVSSWSPTPTETTVPLEPITPWCSQLPLLAGAPVTGSKALSGAVPDFFSRLGPGEMVTLTTALTDKWKRRRDPFIGSINPMTGAADWPVGLTARLSSAITGATDWVDASFAPRAGYTTTPAVGIPPSILTLASIAVFPV
jgi:hypothetical protein